ncbi:MAG: beta-N-acetylhexosaminidase [Limnochordia bacterium]|nr:beta-N-acetylhexosaminidase [Limnochordia bacterium]
MKLNITGCTKEVHEGVALLAEDLSIESKSEGIPVVARRTEGNLRVYESDGSYTIEYAKETHFFRGLGLLVQALRKKHTVNIDETPQFDMNGIMVDVSRNSVMTTDTIKQILRKMAIMGLDTLMLYTEDTYEVESQPYFGYMRGRYSACEIRDCDAYAQKLGIEMVPCIQTLAHLSTALRWDKRAPLRDTDDILLVGDEKTYAFIEELIATVASMYSSKRIHIGMDEAMMLGLGRYLDQNGYRQRYDIMLEHLNRVIEITSKYGLKPMMWSDMFFRLGSKTRGYYDLESSISDDVAKSIPKEVGLVYWDYYHDDPDFYTEWIRRHKKLGTETIFAGGIWAWNGCCLNYGKTFRTTNAALAACKKEEVRQVFATIWHDNGAEVNILQTLLGMQLFAEHGYHDKLNIESLKERFHFCTGAPFEAFWDLRSLDEVPGVGEDNLATNNPSKYLLWQDPLLGLFDKHAEGHSLGQYYGELEQRFNHWKNSLPQWSLVFEVPEKMAAVLKIKAEIGLRMTEAYQQKDHQGLKGIMEEDLPSLQALVEQLRTTHRKQWFATYKPFGWEILDIRYGGVLSRIDSAKWRLQQYLAGDVPELPELEEERLSFNGREPATIIRCNQYTKIASANPF